MGHHTPPTQEPGRGADRETVPARGGASRSSSVPFAWQHGNRLLLLEEGPRGWLMAELRFDPVGCYYVEVRRARYRWAREAAGALLSRALVVGDEGVERISRDLQSWLAPR